MDVTPRCYLRRTKYARHIPLIFVDGAPEKVEAIRLDLPDATFTTRERLCARNPDGFGETGRQPGSSARRHGEVWISDGAQKLGIRATLR